MPTYLDRYLSGEHEAVWADLLALGQEVHREPVFADAMGVARETMLRARTNIETLISRLDAIGYRFETARNSDPALFELLAELRDLGPQSSPRNQMFETLLSTFDPQRAPVSTLDDLSVYSRASQPPSSITSLESYLGGPLPLSLKAWYECVQHVSFAGSHPVLNPAGPAATSPLPDPFSIMPLPDEVDYESWECEDGYPIAVDEFFKANISRDHRYYIDFRDSRADALFQHWRNEYFVAYLRRVFQWGGFPGWERHPNPPLQLIAQLTEGLLPI